MFRRATVIADPPSGDYILSPTGFSWNVRRSNGDGSVMGLSSGERDKHKALAMVLRLAEGDGTDAWETVGTGVFWLVKRCRPASDRAAAGRSA